MARNYRRSRRARPFNLRRVRLASGISVGAVAALDVVEASITTATSNPLRIMSVNISYKLTDLADVIDDGMEFGLAHGDYSAAEIEECLEAQAGINKNDKVANEQANRLVRSIGVMQGSGVADGSLQFNNGLPVKTKLNWYIGIGQTLSLWVRNGSDTIWTSGTNIVVLGDIWVKDSI